MDTETVNYENSRFDNELLLALSGKLPESHIFYIGKPGKILQKCGFPKDILGLDKALQSPVAVFEYGDRKKSQNVVVNIKQGEKNFLAGIHFNQKTRGYEVSDLRTLYPKDNIEWLNWIGQGKMIYGNKKELQALTAQQRMNVAEVSGKVAQSPLHERCLKSVDTILGQFGDVNDIFTDGNLFYTELKKLGEIEQKFYSFYTSKGNLDARILSDVESKEFYKALKEADLKKLREYYDGSLHEISGIASEIAGSYGFTKAVIGLDDNKNQPPTTKSQEYPVSISD